MPFRNQTRSLYEGTLVSYTYSSPVCRDGLPNATIGSLLEQHRKIYLAAKYSTLLRESNVACRAASASQHRSIAMKRYLPTYPLPTYPLTHLPTHPPTYLPTYICPCWRVLCPIFLGSIYIHILSVRENMSEYCSGVE